MKPSKFICAILSLIVLVGGIFPVPAVSRRAAKNEKPELRVRGRVLEAALRSTDTCCVVIDLKLKLEFFNDGERPLILLSREPWIVGELFSVSDEDARAGKFIYSNYHLPSILRAPGNKWEQLEHQLDQPTPPESLTRILSPGETWGYETDTWWTIDKKENYEGRSESWDSIKQHSHVWLSLEFEMWPVNVEPRVNPSKLAFGKKLRHRWRESGVLRLDSIRSEPMELNLGSLKVGGR
jgi:hypothetical protein